MRILYIGNNVSLTSSGFDRLNQRNLELINRITKGNYDMIEFSNKSSFLDRIMLHIGGTSFDLIHRIMVQLQKQQYDFIFFSSSLHGPLIKKIKRKFPRVKIICNFHNIEKQYAQEYLQVSGLMHLPFYIAARYSEKKAVRYMDYSLLLNERDANLLKTEYGKDASLILPIAYKDSCNEAQALSVIKSVDKIQYLFVGIAFFANIEAIKWFKNKVLPFIPGELIIVGKGMDDFQTELSSERVRVEGYVENLSQYYYNATFVISPILSGGGMKTKIAEALMYGKTIIGSKEAFEGFIQEPKSMYICNTSKNYIETINKLIAEKKIAPYNKISRDLFKSNYNINSIYQKFEQVVSKWNQILI